VAELTRVTRYDIILAAAAPVDFKPKEAASRKLESGQTLKLELTPTPKVLENVNAKPKVLVAFAAETVSSYNELEAKALAKLAKYNADVIVANVVGRPGTGFASEYIDAYIITRDNKKIRLGRILKEEAAMAILDVVQDYLGAG